jgi:hypothetical protein
MLTLISLIVFAPYTEEFVINAESGIQMCPDICIGDVTVSTAIKPVVQNGDFIKRGRIIVYVHEEMMFSNYILATPGQYVCTMEANRTTVSNSVDKTCENNIHLGLTEYYVTGNQPDLAQGLMFHEEHNVSHTGIVIGREIVGLDPVVVANWSEYMDFVKWGAGHIYDMTIQFPAIHIFIFGSS